jgi:hypothetical protein
MVHACVYFLVDKNLPVKSKALLFGALMLAVSKKPHIK